MAHASFTAHYIDPFQVEWPTIVVVAPDVTPIIQAGEIVVVAPHVGVPVATIDGGDVEVIAPDVAYQAEPPATPDIRRVDTWESTASGDYVVFSRPLRAGDRVVYAVAGLDTNASFSLNGVAGTDWFILSGFAGVPVGVIQLLTDVPTAGRVSSDSILPGLPVVGVAAVYRNVDWSDGTYDYSTGDSGGFPDVTYTSPDGRATVVRAISYHSVADSGPDVDFGDATPVTQGNTLEPVDPDPEDDIVYGPWPYAGCVAIAEQVDYQGPPSGPGAWVLGNADPSLDPPSTGSNAYLATAVLLNYTIPEEIPTDLAAPVGSIMIPADIDP